jgi:hypothetical protein
VNIETANFHHSCERAVVSHVKPLLYIQPYAGNGLKILPVYNRLFLAGFYRPINYKLLGLLELSYWFIYIFLLYDVFVSLICKVNIRFWADFRVLRWV